MSAAEITVKIDGDSVERAQRAIRSASAEIEDGAVRFLLDGLDVASIAKLKQLVDDGRDADLACWFTPQCIRDHFDIGDGGGELDAWVASADEDTLRKVGADALSDDRLWQTFHEILVDAIRERL